ncbi:hypothetical protein IW261DRAFT_977445 [Armillaria novae-zelandiae]|uniref:Uncharacterized protein n=1 Tax=Armillaria novae-zelandiae TaxID=153914 RepID=A0AA39ULI5_9AGAR|nr:hypothetical protein IW261DRAFT_977445 [Armillaria novae-zelandiae]
MSRATPPRRISALPDRNLMDLNQAFPDISIVERLLVAFGIFIYAFVLSNHPTWMFVLYNIGMWCASSLGIISR